MQPSDKMMQQFKKKANELLKIRAVQDIKPEIYRETTMSQFKGKTKGRYIEYIFVSEEFDIMDVEIVRYNQAGKYPSDYYPLLAEVQFK